MTSTMLHRSILAVFTAIIVVLVGLAALVVGSRLAGYEAVVIRGASMEPTLPLGSLALVNHNDVDGTPGSIVTIRRPNGVLVTHRVIGVVGDLGTHLQLKGDANESPDGRPVPLTSVVGTVTHFLPFAGFLAFLLQQPSGLVAMVSLLGSLFLVMRLIQDEDPVAESQAAGSSLPRSIGTALVIVCLVAGSLGAPQPVRASFGETISTNATFGTAPSW